VEVFVSGLAGSVAPLEPVDKDRITSGIASLVATRYGDPVWNAGRKPPE
jgi:hypothetical protein